MRGVKWGLNLQQYKVVFDLLGQPTAFDSSLLPLLILPVVGLVLVITPQAIVDRYLPNGPKGVAGKIFAWVFFLFTGSISATWLYGTLQQTSSLKSAEETGRTSIVEGCLQYFHPMPESGHDLEKIEIGGRVFSYSDYVDTPAFHTTESHGGPIHPDSKVRLIIVGNDIVRVEVVQKACPVAPEFPKGTLPS